MSAAQVISAELDAELGRLRQRGGQHRGAMARAPGGRGDVVADVAADSTAAGSPGAGSGCWPGSLDRRPTRRCCSAPSRSAARSPDRRPGARVRGRAQAGVGVPARRRTRAVPDPACVGVGRAAAALGDEVGHGRAEGGGQRGVGATSCGIARFSVGRSPVTTSFPASAPSGPFPAARFSGASWATLSGDASGRRFPKGTFCPPGATRRRPPAGGSRLRSSA